jgi:hypothetical protein
MENDIDESTLPIWARWLAQDADGTWWAYEAEPHIAERSWYENEVGESIVVIKKAPNAQWKNSLKKIR